MPRPLARDAHHLQPELMSAIQAIDEQRGHTVHFASEAMGPNFLLMLPPALKRATFTPLKLHARV